MLFLIKNSTFCCLKAGINSKLTVKNEVIKLKKGQMLYAGSEEKLNAIAKFPDLNPVYREVSGEATITAGKLVFAKNAKAEVSLEDYEGELIAWNAPGKKAASYK